MFLLYLYDSMRKEEPSGYATIIPFGILCMLPVLIPAITETIAKYGLKFTILILFIIWLKSIVQQNVISSSEEVVE